jgi:CO/xanthine dehydrogenase FAD-binding subunit
VTGAAGSDAGCGWLGRDLLVAPSARTRGNRPDEALPMNLNTITEVRRLTGDDTGVDWRDGDSWVAGGTWLFSEPQPHLRRLLDLQGIGWEPLVVGERGLQIAATCTIAELVRLVAPPEWTAAPLIGQCCRSFLASFKIWNVATVGGNICMSLPAGPMISLAVGLEGVCTLRTHDGSERRVAAEEFVTGNHHNVLQPGELLRAIDLPSSALSKRTCFRRMSLTHLGRSTVLLVGTQGERDATFMLTVSAATVRPIRLVFPQLPDGPGLRRELERAIPDEMYLEDAHGSPDYRKHLTLRLAEEIRAEFAGPEPPSIGGDQSDARPA